MWNWKKQNNCYQTIENTRKINRGMKQNKKRTIGIWVLSLLCGFLCAAAVEAAAGAEKQATIQHGIANEILRFHVIANSDSKEDQDLKYAVRDKVAVHMEQLLQEETDLEETKRCVTAHMQEIQTLAEEVVKEQGYSYPVSISLSKDRFPEKIYGDCTFPAGIYDALRIEIGKAQGKNWWCVIYPNLCLAEGSYTVVSEEGHDELKSMMTEEEYNLITNGGSVKVRFKFLPFLNDLFAD